MRPSASMSWNKTYISYRKPLGPDSISRWHLTSIVNSIVEIRRSYDRVISTMGFPMLVRWHIYIKSGPCCIFSMPAERTGEFYDQPHIAWPNVLCTVGILASGVSRLYIQSCEWGWIDKAYMNIQYQVKAMRSKHRLRCWPSLGQNNSIIYIYIYIYIYI